MDRLLEAVLRADLGSFVRKVFATVSPGQPYLHNWHVDAIVHQLMRNPLRRTNEPRSVRRTACRSLSIGVAPLIVVGDAIDVGGA
jgi:hypothetical protein